MMKLYDTVLCESLQNRLFCNFGYISLSVLQVTCDCAEIIASEQTLKSF